MKYNTKIRMAGVADAEGIATTQIITWKKAYANLLPQETLDNLSIIDSTKNWRKRLDNSQSFTLVAELDDSIIGFVSFGDYREDRDKNIAEIYAIYIIPNYWEGGIGSSLLSKAIEDISTKKFELIVLWVFEQNSLARSFYEKSGFIITDETKKDERLNNLIEVKYKKHLI